MQSFDEDSFILSIWLMPSSNFTTTEPVELRLRSAPILIFVYKWCHKITEFDRDRWLCSQTVKVAPVSGLGSVAFSSVSVQMSSTIDELFVCETSNDPCSER